MVTRGAGAVLAFERLGMTAGVQHRDRERLEAEVRALVERSGNNGARLVECQCGHVGCPSIFLWRCGGILAGFCPALDNVDTAGDQNGAPSIVQPSGKWPQMASPSRLAQIRPVKRNGATSDASPRRSASIIRKCAHPPSMPLITSQPATAGVTGFQPEKAVSAAGGDNRERRPEQDADRAVAAREMPGNRIPEARRHRRKNRQDQERLEIGAAGANNDENADEARQDREPAPRAPAFSPKNA